MGLSLTRPPKRGWIILYIMIAETYGGDVPLKNEKQKKE
jgi:hypothetical protein